MRNQTRSNPIQFAPKPACPATHLPAGLLQPGSSGGVLQTLLPQSITSTLFR